MVPSLHDLASRNVFSRRGRVKLHHIPGFLLQQYIAIPSVYIYSDNVLSCSSCIEATKILCGQHNVRFTNLLTFQLDVL